MNLQHQAPAAALLAQRPKRPHGTPALTKIRLIHRAAGIPCTCTHRHSPRLRHRGFTLIELLVVLAIIAIFLSLAIPSFRGLIANVSVSSAVNAFIADTRYARGEALRRGKNVMVCRSANPAANPPACSAASAAPVGSWMEGWLVFVDENGNGKFDAASDTAVRVQQTLTGIGSFLALNNNGSANNSQNYIAYDATGRAVGQQGRWLVQAQGTSSAANTTQTRTLCLNMVGRVNTYTGGIPCPS